MSDLDVYERFVAWLGTGWWELPESEHLMPMIRAHYTPEEAALLTGMPFSSKSVAEVAALKAVPAEELGPRLKELARKGMLYESGTGASARYRLSDAMFAFLRANLWPGGTDPRTRATAPLINRYYLDGWADQWAEVHTKGLRVLPIEKTLEDTRHVLAFEDVVKVIEDREYYTVSTCPCRHRHNLDPEMPDCNHPDEVCLHFDELGRYAVENGMGREITREETFAILRKAADSGLVHGVSNWVERPDTICNCCSCCCLMFETHHKLGHDESLTPAGYTARVDAGACSGCALCVKRCPMDALQLKVTAAARNKVGKTAVVDPRLCIGCGVCAHRCPTDALALVREGEAPSPPRDARDWVARFLSERQATRTAAGPSKEG